MLTLHDITQFFPPSVHLRSRGMLREYLQYLILSILYTSKYRSKMVFLGGTCLRIAYNSQRFSEDLDFDNRGMSLEDFTDLGGIIARELGEYGFDTEVKTVFKGAFHCSLRIPKILFDYGLSGYEDEKILIQIDTVPQPIEYQSEAYTLGNFGVRETILITPKDMLLSQKITAAYGRKRTQGRDFYDIQYLFSWGVRPNYEYLALTIGVHDIAELQAYMLEHNACIDFESLTRDLEPFLFRSDDLRLVREFPAMVERMKGPL